MKYIITTKTGWPGAQLFGFKVCTKSLSRCFPSSRSLLEVVLVLCLQNRENPNHGSDIAIVSAVIIQKPSWSVSEGTTRVLEPVMFVSFDTKAK